MSASKEESYYGSSSQSYQYRYQLRRKCIHLLLVVSHTILPYQAQQLVASGQYYRYYQQLLPVLLVLQLQYSAGRVDGQYYQQLGLVGATSTSQYYLLSQYYRYRRYLQLRPATYQEFLHVVGDFISKSILKSTCELNTSRYLQLQVLQYYQQQLATLSSQLGGS